MKLSSKLAMYAVAALSLLNPSQAKAGLTRSSTNDKDKKDSPKGWAISAQASSGILFSHLPSLGYKEITQQNAVRVDYMGTRKGRVRIGPYIGARFLMQYQDRNFNVTTPTYFQRGGTRTAYPVSMDYRGGARADVRFGEKSNVFLDAYYQKSLNGGVPRGRPGSPQPTRPISRSGPGATAGMSLHLFKMSMSRHGGDDKRMVDVQLYGDYGIRKTREADARGRVSHGIATEAGAGIAVRLKF